MQRLLRIVLMSLLVLTIPVKGFAAAGMLASAASHPPHHAAVFMPDGSAAVHEHASVGEHEAMGHGDRSHANAPPGEPHEPNCSSACGACCVAAGITGSVALLPALPEVADARPAAPLLAPLRLCIGGLDRPPRILFA